MRESFGFHGPNFQIAKVNFKNMAFLTMFARVALHTETTMKQGRILSQNVNTPVKLKGPLLHPPHPPPPQLFDMHVDTQFYTPWRFVSLRGIVLLLSSPFWAAAPKGSVTYAFT